MNWLTKLVHSNRNALAPELLAKIGQWQGRTPDDLGRPHFETRYVVVNTEATGLDLDHDRLLAVGAIAIENGVLAPTKATYLPLDKDPAAALAGLLEFAAGSPWVVFNAAFNRSMLEKYCTEHIGIVPNPEWLDLQWLLPALYPEHQTAQVRLGFWMDAFGIETFQRHHGLGDAYVVAQLLMAAIGRGLVTGMVTPRNLLDIERERRWSQRGV